VGEARERKRKEKRREENYATGNKFRSECLHVKATWATQFLRRPLRPGYPPGHQYWNEASSCAADQAISFFCGLASTMNRW